MSPTATPRDTPLQPARRRSREQSQAQTRDGLIATATRLFIEKGYGGTSIRDIADQAGFSQGAFYSNFDSKEALLLEMLRRHMQAEAEQLTALMAQERRSPDVILDDLEVWAAAIDQGVNWSMLSIELQLHAQRSETFATAYQAIWRHHQSVLASWINRLFALSGVPCPLATEEIASSLMALAHGLALQRTATGGGATGRVIAVFLRGLLALGRRQAD